MNNKAKKKSARRIKGKLTEAELVEALDIIQGGLALALENISQLLHHKNELLAAENNNLQKQTEQLQEEKICSSHKALISEFVSHISDGGTLQ